MKCIWVVAGVAVEISVAMPAAARTKDSLDAVARDYVVLQLAIGEKEEGYIDAYYGPVELQARGKSLGSRTSVAALRTDTRALSERLARLSKADATLEGRRAHFLGAQLTAADTRLRMLQGEKLSFDEEARGLFSVAPDLQPLSAYDPVLAEIRAAGAGHRAAQ